MGWLWLAARSIRGKACSAASEWLRQGLKCADLEAAKQIELWNTTATVGDALSMLGTAVIVFQSLRSESQEAAFTLLRPRCSLWHTIPTARPGCVTVRHYCQQSFSFQMPSNTEWIVCSKTALLQFWGSETS